jgi:hypothetical protein
VEAVVCCGMGGLPLVWTRGYPRIFL